VALEPFGGNVEVTRPIEEGTGASPRVVEQMEEIRVKHELVDEFIDVNLPNPIVVVRLMEEVVIKHEFIEQCSKRRAPIQDRYRLLFK